MSLWIYLHFPRLQLDTLFGDNQEQPVVIVESQRGRIIQYNDIAEQQGIKPNMGLGSAASLCRGLQVHPYHPKTELNKLQEIAQWLYLITSDVVLMPNKGLLLRATPMLSLYEGLQNYWHKVTSHLGTLKLTFQFGCGFSPFAAKLMALSGSNQLTENSEFIQQSLSLVPLTLTDLSTVTVDKLQRVGVSTLQDLLELPLQDIARRFDIDLVNYVGRLTGQFRHPVDFYHPTESFQVYLELLFELENVQWIEKPLVKLLRQLETFLKLRNKVAFELRLTLHQRDKQEQHLQLTSAQGDYLSQRWLQLASLNLGSLALNGPVIGLSLQVIRQGEPISSACDLFAGQKGQMNNLELLSLLQAKLGKSAVLKPNITCDPRPEKACQYRPADEPDVTISAIPHLFRPAMQLPAPIPLQEQVALVHGPERIVSGWWDGDEIMRDYYIAHTKQGRWLWVFRDQHKHWFLHGYFC
ncbi:Nucleotidyltransferase DNA polymerase involved in DNA repair [Vibrio sp. B1FLJ16]|uniref:Y-family DNA polymerase n=1 Tax=Vibrio sp. B1FLJ16 TaxID=2751178 RepID=UPI0015F3D4F4|nr:DNA polymerase Y family protein [Vibrio sp. B1FLJ16]CAD7803037.1 Nucleotidyltransferase DNA polymerase involved in DNA repair [Vibrio sp. B1FLJ16]CAE6894017.1 Nucleotidyltransferase DNA polymerase involved in DNA repair [Vibrio sp. B1FLJ16]